MASKDSLQIAAQVWADPRCSGIGMDARLAEVFAEFLDKQEEDFTMKLAAISTASIQNTASSIKDRINPDSPYWTVAYGDVCRAVDREMKERKRAISCEEALNV